MNKKNKINSLKTDIIIDDTVKIKKNNNLDFLNNKNDFRRGNKRKKKPYNKENNNRNKKIRIVKLNRYYKKKLRF